MPVFGNSIYYDKYNTIVNEAYIGKTPLLLEIEKELAALKEEHLKMTDVLSQNKHIININRLFEKQFGMHTFALKVWPTQTINAYTMVLAANFDIANDVDLPKWVEGDITNGFRYKAGNNFCVIVHISWAIICSEEYSSEETLAIILHEIGHNFADCLYSKINLANKKMMQEYEKYLADLAVSYGILSALTLGLALPLYIKVKREQKKFNNEYNQKQIKKASNHGRFYNKLHGLVSGINAKIADRIDIRDEILARLRGKSEIEAYKRMKGEAAKKDAKKSLARQNEVIADKFAGIYGYGPALAIALDRMTVTNDAAQNKIATMSKRAQKASQDYDDALRNIHEYDCHPQYVQRLMEELKLLEREFAKDDIDPKVKDEIKAQIDQLYEILDKITDVNTKINKEFSKNEESQRAYNDYVAKKCPDAVSKEIEESIEEALDKLFEESKKKNKKK